MRTGWFKESWRHSLASKGIKTSRRSYAKGVWHGPKVWDPVARKYKDYAHQQAALKRPIKDLIIRPAKEVPDLSQVYPREAIANFAQNESSLPVIPDNNLSITSDSYSYPMPAPAAPRFTDEEDTSYIPETSPQGEFMDKQQAQPVESPPLEREELPRSLSQNIQALQDMKDQKVQAEVPGLEDLESKESSLDSANSGPVQAQVMDW